MKKSKLHNLAHKYIHVCSLCQPSCQKSSVPPSPILKPAPLSLHSKQSSPSLHFCSSNSACNSSLLIGLLAKLSKLLPKPTQIPLPLVPPFVVPTFLQGKGLQITIDFAISPHPILGSSWKHRPEFFAFVPSGCPKNESEILRVEESCKTRQALVIITPLLPKRPLVGMKMEKVVRLRGCPMAPRHPQGNAHGQVQDRGRNTSFNTPHLI